jgi:hypothetical protein
VAEHAGAVAGRPLCQCREDATRRQKLSADGSSLCFAASVAFAGSLHVQQIVSGVTLIVASSRALLSSADARRSGFWPFVILARGWPTASLVDIAR